MVNPVSSANPGETPTPPEVTPEEAQALIGTMQALKNRLIDDRKQRLKIGEEKIF